MQCKLCSHSLKRIGNIYFLSIDKLMSWLFLDSVFGLVSTFSGIDWRVEKIGLQTWCQKGRLQHLQCLQLPKCQKVELQWHDFVAGPLETPHECVEDQTLEKILIDHM